MDLIFVRHAEPGRQEQPAGIADPPLLERGAVQARALAAWLSTEPIDAVVHSPALRAAQTAEPIAQQHGLEPVTSDALVEYDWGSSSYVPVTRHEVRDHLAVNVTEFQKRVVIAIEELIGANPGRRVVAVCHGGVINAYVGQILGIEQALWFYPDYTGITRVAAARTGQRTLVSLNETGHLKDTGALARRKTDVGGPAGCGSRYG